MKWKETLIHFLKNKVLGIIIVGIAGSFIYDLIKSAPILTTISSFITWIGKLLMMNIPVWAAILSMLVLGTSYFIIKWYKDNEYKNFLNFNEGFYFDVLWKWRYRPTSDPDKFVVVDVKPYHAGCDTQLLFYEDSGLFICGQCGSGFDLDGKYNEAKRLIEIDIRKRDPKNQAQMK